MKCIPEYDVRTARKKVQTAIGSKHVVIMHTLSLHHRAHTEVELQFEFPEICLKTRYFEKVHKLAGTSDTIFRKLTFVAS